MTMTDDNELKQLASLKAPAPRAEAKARALAAAMQAFEENSAAAPKGSHAQLRLTDRIGKIWREMMQKKLIAAPALTALIALPIAGYTTFHLMQDQTFDFGSEQVTDSPVIRQEATSAEPAKEKKADAESVSRDVLTELQAQPAPKPEAPANDTAPEAELSRDVSGLAAPAPAEAPLGRAGVVPGSVATSKMMADQSAGAPAPIDIVPQLEENRDRFEEFKTNPVRAAATDPVSTFSIDVDTASYSFVRRSLKEGFLPQADTVRVEEMVNYFPYDWKGPDAASTPFNSTVTVMPTPWNGNTKLMHVAIKGYDVQPAEQPRANLVFLIDVSGSMNEPDKLPLLQSAFRLLVRQLNPEDTVSIVTYAGEAGTVLEPTKVSERAKILSAIDNLRAGRLDRWRSGHRGSLPACAAVLRRGRRQPRDAGDRRRLQCRPVATTTTSSASSRKSARSGVFLSVFGFGRGNLNDQMMQTIAQNGNGTAAYIDTLARPRRCWFRRPARRSSRSPRT